MNLPSVYDNELYQMPKKGHRQIILDTETTGMPVTEGHRIIEIGCVEMIDRELTGRNYHVYINPERLIDEEAMKVHGITDEYLEDKPVFAEIAETFLEFVKDSELVIHNAPFDMGFLNMELQRTIPKFTELEAFVRVFDTLAFAKKKHPGQRNNLDALCRRYGIDNSHRELHGALLDAEILADVFLFLTGGQKELAFTKQKKSNLQAAKSVLNRETTPVSLKVLRANAEEEAAHQAYLKKLSKGGACIWTALSNHSDA